MSVGFYMNQFLKVLGARQQTLKSPWWEGSMLAKLILAKGVDADGENVANCYLYSATKSLCAVVSNARLQNNVVTLTLRASSSRCLLAGGKLLCFVSIGLNRHPSCGATDVVSCTRVPSPRSVTLKTFSGAGRC